MPRRAKTDKKNNKRGNNDIVQTPTKTARKESDEDICWAFLMDKGDIVTFDDLEEKLDHEKDFGECIVESKSFQSINEMDAWKKATEHCKTPSPKGVAKTDGSDGFIKMSPSDKAKVLSNLDKVEERKASNKLRLYWKTTGRSKVVCAVLRFQNSGECFFLSSVCGWVIFRCCTLCYIASLSPFPDGQDVWHMKPNFIAPALNAYNEVFKQENSYVSEFLDNISHGLMRDLSGDINKVKTKTWKSPNGGKDREYDQFLNKSWFNLPPLAELPTKEDEDAFIAAMAKEILDALLYVFKTEAFATFYKHAISNDKVWKAITNDSYGYVSFVTTAKTVAEKCDNFNAHLTRSDASELATLLYDHRYSGKKYDEYQDASNALSDAAREPGQPSNDEIQATP